ncbi:MAG: glycosyltransferase [Candidatus Omnitrophota bacterium]
MKILIVHASAGGGHRAAAIALSAGFKDKYPDVKVEVLDILQFNNPVFTYFYSVGYSILAIYLKFIWMALYYLSSYTFVRGIFQFISLVHSQRFVNYLIRENPDVILSTHFLPPFIASCLKLKNKISSRLVTVITDFRAHPIWITSKCDNYVVACDYTVRDLLRRGVDEAKIKVLGIPVDKQFVDLGKGRGIGIGIGRDMGKENSAAEGEFRVLLATGSLGFMLMEDIADMLHNEVKMTIVCGRNKFLFKRLKKKNYSNVTLLGFTDQMPELMSKASLLITKPGGLSISESLVMQIPLIFIDGIPGQESGNSEVLVRSGCAWQARRLEDIRDIVMDLKNNRQRVDLLRGNIQKIRKPDAAQEICKLCMLK